MKKKLFLFVLSLCLVQSTFAQISRSNNKKSVPYRTNYQRMASGSSASHTFEIRQGTLWGWGLNTSGQLGDGTTSSKTSPVQIGTDTKWVLLAAGGIHTLGLKSDGTLWAWGVNTNGQLGDGTTVQKTSPVQIGTDTKWVSIAAGSAYSLGLKSDGTLWAWGINTNGQLGDGTTTLKSSPTQIGTDTKWTGVAAGTSHSLGLKADGTLWAWGLNTNGRLGDGTSTQRTAPVQIGTDIKWTNIAAGGSHSLGIKSDGTLWGWGLNTSGQIGDGTIVSKTSPVQIGTDTKWVSITGGSLYSMGSKADGTLWSWGVNTAGQLGDGTVTQKNSPVQIGTDTRWVSITSGVSHSLGLKADGTLWAWGLDANGQLGDGSTTQRTTPFQIIGAHNEWISITTSAIYTNGVKADGTLWAWGNGPLGNGTNSSQTSPVQIGTDTKWISVESGPIYTLALKSDGTLWAWGDNTSGQLGDGSTVSRNSPVQIGVDTKWVSIAAGLHSLGLKSDGTLWAWGDNSFGQLGDGSITQRTSPIQIGSDTKWVHISAGLTHSTGIKSDGTFWAWGNNGYGQLGDGTNTSQNSPIQIGIDTKWTSLAGGRAECTLALKADGTLWTWGHNSSGQLGDGTTIDKNSPIQIGTDTKWMSVNAGHLHSLGVKADGSLWTWGDNADGELGDNIASYIPAQQGTGMIWLSISGGDHYTIGLRSGRDQYCASGSNNGGQLGDGTYTNRTSFSCNIHCLPPNSSLVVSGPVALCASKTGNVFTVTNPTTGATYTWSVPGGASIVSGQGTPALTVNWGTASGSVTVTETSSCGSAGSPVSKAVSVSVPYALGSTDIFCGGIFRIPLVATSPVNGGTIGIDFAINYSAAQLTPTGVALTGKVATSYGSYSINTTTAGKVYVSVYMNNAPNGVYFSGTGEIAYVYFQVNAGVNAGNIVTLTTDGIEESTLVGTNMNCQVLPVNITVKSAVAGTLIYRNTPAATLNYDPANPSTYVISTVAGVNALCTSPSANLSTPDLSGIFKYGTANGANLLIQRDVTGDFTVPTLTCSNVQSVINSTDRIQAADIATFKTTAVPIYTLLSADVNLDGKVTSGDVTLISSRSVNGNNCEFPQSNYTWNGTMWVPAAGYVKSQDWLFVDDATLATAAFTTGTGRNNVPRVPSCVPAPTGTASCTPSSTATYHAILLGDVDGNWTSTSGAQMRNAVSDAIIVDLNRVTMNAAGNYVIPVYYEGDDKYSGMDFSIDYSKAVSILNVKTNSSLSGVGSEFNNIAGQRLMVTSYTQDPLNTVSAISFIEISSVNGKPVPEDFSNARAYLNGKPVELKFGFDEVVLQNKVHADIYPNPFNTETCLYVEDVIAFVKVTITTTSGIRVYENDQVPSNQVYKIDPLIDEGIYLVTIVCSKGTITKKLVKI